MQQQENTFKREEEITLTVSGDLLTGAYQNLILDRGEHEPTPERVREFLLEMIRMGLCE